MVDWNGPDHPCGPGLTDLLIYVLTYLLTYLLTHLLTHLLMEKVPITHAVLASDNVVRRCMSRLTKAGRMTSRLVEGIATGRWSRGPWTHTWPGPEASVQGSGARAQGAEAFVRAIRERGPSAILAELKASSIGGGA